MGVRTEPQAPHWLVQLLRPQPVPVPWRRVGRAALGIAGPVAVGMLAGRLDLGVLASIGGLCGTFADNGGPYRHRVRRIGSVVSAGGLGFLLGTATSASTWLSALVVVAVAAVSAMISAGGDTASAAGLQLLVFTVVGSAQTADPLVAFGCFAAGAAFALVLAIAAWPVLATAPERLAVAAVYDELSAVLRASGTADARPARRRLTAALTLAYDRLLGARSRLAGRDRAYRRLLDLLSATTPVVEASVATVSARGHPDPVLTTHLTALAGAIRADLPFPRPPALTGGTVLHDALRRLHEHDDTAPEPKPRAGTRQSRVDRLRDALGKQTWLFVLRLTLCVALAELVGLLLPLHHANWVALTVAIVLKPDFGSVFGRAVLRAGGTAVGVLLGAGVLALAPHGWLLLVVMALVAAALPVGQVRNYGMFSTFVTPLVIVQLDLANAGNATLVLARLADTAIGCLIVLVFGYLLWPGSTRADVGEQLAVSCTAVADYLERALTGAPQGRATLRRRAYRELADLRTVFQRAVVEPSAGGRRAAAWWPLIVSLERAADAITRLAVDIERGAPPSRPADVAVLRDALTGAATAVRANRAPARPALPAAPELAALVVELDAVLGTLRGPVRTRPRRTWLAGTRRRGRGSAG